MKVEQREMKNERDAGRTGGWARVLPWAVGGAVLAAFLALVCRKSYIYSTSDPHNWLVFARNFVEEFGQSRWPYGYPLYLRGMLALLGKYWVFLANLPALLGMFAVAGWIGTMFAGEDGGGKGAGDGAGMPRAWGFLAVWVVIFGANSGELMRYVNPYRDPLSYLLLLASVGVFARALKARRMWGVGAAGALLGLACSVREPSVLMLLPLFAYGLLAWRSGRPELGFWKTAGAFALGLGLGVAPMLVQSYLSTHQVLVPHNLLLNVPETQEESKIVPGMYFTGVRLGQVLGKAGPYYWGTEKLLLALAAAGLAAAVRRRNRLVLAVVAPTALGYAAFYSFYRIFVPRYFYVAVLFCSLLAGYGLLSLMRWAFEKMPSRRAGRAAGWVLLAAMACWTSARLWSTQVKFPPHHACDARAMEEEIRGICPDADAVFANRPLCEWIDWFVGCESAPLTNRIPGTASAEAPGKAGLLRETLAPRLERGEKLYAAFWATGADAEGDVPYVRRAFDRHLAGSFDPAAHTAELYADGRVWIYRLACWSNLETAVEWPVPARGKHGGAYWFMLDAGEWPEGHASATLAVGGGEALWEIPEGGTLVGSAEAGEGEAGRRVAAAVASADPLPGEIPVRTGRLDEPMELDFRMGGTFDHYRRWTGDIRLPECQKTGVGVFSGADLDLPVPWPERAGGVVELWFATDRKAPGVVVPVDVSADGCAPVRAEVNGNGNGLQTRLVFPLPFDAERASRPLHFDVQAQAAPTGDTNRAPIGVECLRAVLHRWPGGYPVLFGIGAVDAIHALGGFGRPEKSAIGASRRLTGAAEMGVYLPETASPLVLRIAGARDGMPQEVRDAGGEVLRVAWDGVGLAGEVTWGEDGESFMWEGALPEGAGDGKTAHRVGLESPMWREADGGNGKSRTVGVRIGRVAVAEREGE